MLLSVDYKRRIKFFGGNNSIDSHLSYLDSLPDICPICSYAIEPHYILIYEKDEHITELFCGCPRDSCGALFTTVYEGEQDWFEEIRKYPNSRTNTHFPPEVIEISPNFVKVYNQAEFAEKEGLDLICGVGYRKSLEYLIKDFSCNQFQSETEKIEKMPLQQCIQRFIEQPDIKDMAERAVWLGNDETHYVRKWANQDVKDLKNLIDLTVYFLSMQLKAEKYKNEMIAGR